MKILLALDGSKFGKKMLAYLVTHDELFGAQHEYELLTVVPALPPRARNAVGKQIADQYYHDEAEKVLAPASTFCERHGLHAKGSYKVGAAAELIVKAAAAGRSDLIVMGSHGHGALGSLVLGSVTNGVLARSTVPVLVIR
jgi:nucleotide-binding universal stress UspA family protein